MLVKERMSTPVISVAPDLPIMEALSLMRREQIRRTPVMKNGKMVGIVSEKDLLDASPSDATSLSVWEISYLLSRVPVSDVMTKDVFTLEEDTPIEEAAMIMVDNKLGGLPVVRGKAVVGLITETDLFKCFLELMGARELGVRVTAIVIDEPGVLASISNAITDAGGNFISFGTFSGQDLAHREIVFKVSDIDRNDVLEVVTPLVERIVDIRDCC
ncbi:MAG TPA: CBS and ACT domain-containing protein [candidate division Zixibacteria bacterium]|nr:CBS and ACT domain-containing protein [candidate division Zixibacteria bacterium]